MINLSTTLHRSPPVDPRRARRQCTDFGSRRGHPLPPLSLSTSDSVLQSTARGSSSPINSTPTPGSTFSSSDSNSDVSSLEDMRFDFPEPPPISPVLRRMKSTPLFIMDDVSTGHLTGRGFHDHAAIATTGLPAHPSERFETFNDLQSDSDQPMSPLSETSIGSPETHPQESESDAHGEQLVLESANWLSLPAFLSCPSSDVDNDIHSAILPSPRRTTNASQNVKPSTSTPPAPFPHERRKVSKMRSLKFSPSCSESVERLDTRIPKANGHKSIVRGRAVSMDFKSYRASFFSPSSDKAIARPPPDLPSAPATTTQTPKKRTTNGPSPGHSKSLSHSGHNALFSTPQKLYKRPLSTVASGHASNTTSNAKVDEFRSFMDISPDREGRRLGNGKDKVRKLLARASTMFEWGKLKRAGKQ
ncbi:hypothetical protein V5O48_006463 [Marasmius crinis-equi]|uniref:Uncharacterized protein n=1 Tax=Marasmius crinis-equi TaxID=585013 RepID=A0ABR3FK17_9AGAR